MKVLLSLATVLLSLTALHAANKPNVLFIAVDDLRPELGCYGNQIVRTPHIDRLAARGTVFNYAYCQQAVCSPSRTSLLTGRRPDATRVWDLETHFRVALPDVITLPQHFKMNGYHCAGLSKIYHKGFEDGRSWNEPHWYPQGKSVDTDLTDYTKQIVTKHPTTVEEYTKGASPDDNDKPEDRKNGKKGKAGGAFEVSPKTDDQLPDGATAAEAVKRLHDLKAKGQPFFLAVGFLKPHLPFVAPKKYWDLYNPDQIPVPAFDKLPAGAPDFAGHNNSELHNYQGVPAENPIPADFAKTLRHGYYACISYIDAQVGRLLDALDKEGLADNTVIVLWGDHGWQLGEHGLWHKHTNFEIATRSPLLISVPQQQTAGRKCHAPVEFVDVYPTLADVCGLPIPTGLAGTSLKPFIENPEAPATKVAISQYPRNSGKTGGGPVMGYSLRNERYRLTLWRERAGTQIVATEFYDEWSDPNETVNLATTPEHQFVMAALAKHLPPALGDAPASKPAAIAATLAAAPAPTGTPTPAPATAAKPGVGDFGTPEERAVKFDRLDKAKAGKLTREEFTSRQSDAEAAGKRFDKWDLNKDGFLSRDEYITQGGKSPKLKP